MTFAQAIEEILEFENQPIEAIPVEVRVHWSENGKHFIGADNHYGNKPELDLVMTPDDFERAVRLVSADIYNQLSESQISREASHYDKTELTVKFSNGDTYSMRIDITGFMQSFSIIERIRLYNNNIIKMYGDPRYGYISAEQVE